MKARLQAYWEKLHTSFWFVPGVMIIESALLSGVTVSLDHRLDQETVRGLPLAFQDGVEGARSLLSAVAASTITVTGVTFSVMIVAFTLASSQFTPRLLRNFTRDLGNEVVLGTLLPRSVIVCSCRASWAGRLATSFPGLSVSCALLLSLASVCTIVYFIHHASCVLLSFVASARRCACFDDGVHIVTYLRNAAPCARHRLSVL